MITIREATMHDLDLLSKLADFYSEDAHQFKALPYSKSHTRTLLAGALADTNHTIFIAELEGKPVGGLWCYRQMHIISPTMVCYEAFNFVHPKARRLGIGTALVERMESWAVNTNCKMVVGGSNSGIVGSAEMYIEHGFQYMGSNHFKLLK